MLRELVFVLFEPRFGFVTHGGCLFHTRGDAGLTCLQRLAYLGATHADQEPEQQGTIQGHRQERHWCPRLAREQTRLRILALEQKPLGPVDVVPGRHMTMVIAVLRRAIVAVRIALWVMCVLLASCESKRSNHENPSGNCPLRVRIGLIMLPLAQDSACNLTRHHGSTASANRNATQSPLARSVRAPLARPAA